MILLPSDLERILDDLFLLFGKYAFDGDVYVEAGIQRTLRVRKGSIEEMRENRYSGCGMRVFQEKRVATLSTSILDRSSLFELLERGKELVPYASTNPNLILCERLGDCESPEIFDSDLVQMPRDALEDIAFRLEREVSGLSKDFINTEGSFSTNVRQVLIRNTKGLRASLKETTCSLSVSCTAERMGERLEGGAWRKRRFLRDLPETRELAEEAADRTLSLIGGRPIETRKAPVVFDRRVASGFLWNLLGMINGEEVNRGRSLLAGKLGEMIASQEVTIIDDGTMPRMTGSRGFDDEGTCTKRKVVVEKGILKTYLDHLSSAKEGGRSPTGNGFRGNFRGRVGVLPTNFYMLRGEHSLDDILKEAKGGLYVMNTLGFGVDLLRGTFSMGAQGRLIEDGRLARPVTGVTIAGDLEDILLSIEMVGEELIFQGPVASPPFLIREMTIGGK